MTDYVIISGFIKKMCKQLFSKRMIMIILKGKRSCAEDRYKSKRSMTFSKSKCRSHL